MIEDCNEAERDQLSARNGVAYHALDPVAAERLWEISAKTLALG